MRNPIQPSKPSVPPLSVHAWLRYDAVRRLLERVDGGTALEIGVGQGSLGVLLARRFDYTGIDLDEEALSTARERFARYGVDASKLIHGGLETVAGRTFDLVCAFEVLEHFERDVAALAEWRQYLKRGGVILLSVPAGPDRFAKADVKAGHYRRYDRPSINKALTSAGFTDVRVLNYGVPAGYVLEAARNLLARRQLKRDLTPEQRTLSSGRWLQPPDAAAPIMRAIAWPLTLAQRPFMDSDRGTGLVALAALPQTADAAR
jgi:SAM-dependent methyltransferase